VPVRCKKSNQIKSNQIKSNQIKSWSTICIYGITRVFYDSKVLHRFSWQAKPRTKRLSVSFADLPPPGHDGWESKSSGGLAPAPNREEPALPDDMMPPAADTPRAFADLLPSHLLYAFLPFCSLSLSEYVCEIRFYIRVINSKTFKIYVFVFSVT